MWINEKSVVTFTSYHTNDILIQDFMKNTILSYFPPFMIISHIFSYTLFSLRDKQSVS